MTPAIPDDLETLLGGEDSAEATFLAALAFVDELQSQEPQDSSHETSPSTGGSDNSSQSAAEESASRRSTKPKRVQKPDYKRQELLYLREAVGELEKKLNELKAAESRYKERLAGESPWATFASKLRLEREQSEEVNKRLREMVEEQIQLSKSLEEMLKKRGYLELLGAVHTSPNVKRVRGQSGPYSVFTAPAIEDDLNRMVCEMYERVDSVFTNSQFAIPRNAAPKRVVEMLCDEGAGTMVRSFDSHVLPFDYVKTASVIWDFVMDRIHINSTCSFQRLRQETEQTKSTKIVKGQMGWLGTTDNFRVLSVAQRHTEANRVVIVTCTLLEPDELGNEKINGVWMRIRAWHIIQPGPDDGLGRPSTHKQSFFMATPEIYTQDDELSGVPTRQDSEVGALTNFILHAVDGQMDLNNQRVERRLADQLSTRQVRD